MPTKKTHKGKYRVIDPKVTTQEDIDRIENTIKLHVGNKIPYEDACKYLQYSHNPILTSLILIEELYNLVAGPIRKYPTYEKHALANEIRQAILTVQKSIVSIACIPSTTNIKIKEASDAVMLLISLFSLSYRTSYISEQLLSKLLSHTSSLKISIALIAEVIKIDKELNKSKQ